MERLHPIVASLRLQGTPVKDDKLRSAYVFCWGYALLELVDLASRQMYWLGLSLLL